MRTGGLRTCGLLFFVLLFWGGPLSVPAAEITDMAGRTVLLPDREPRIFCASPPSLYLLYSLNPSLKALRAGIGSEKKRGISKVLDLNPQNTQRIVLF